MDWWVLLLALVLINFASVVASLAITLAIRRWWEKKRDRVGVKFFTQPPVPETEPVKSSFRARVSSEKYDDVILVSVHGDLFKVEARTGEMLCLYVAVIGLDNVHPEDRARVGELIRAHPTSHDEYEWADG